MALTRAEIQEYLYQLSSKKGFLTEQEIEKCCDENDVDFFDIDKIMQFLIDRKVLIQDEAPVNDIEDEGYDRAQVDYDEIYKEILKRYPEQNYLIAELKKTLPPQRNEWQTLVPQAKNGNMFARNRIISMYSRNLFRSAYNFSISFGSDINNSFEDAVEGLIKALNSYDITSPQPFPGYYPYYVYAAMQRNYEKNNAVYEIPNHHYQELFQFLTPNKSLIEKYGINNFLDYVPERKLIEFKEKNLYAYEYLQPLIALDFNRISYDDKIPEKASYESLRKLLNKLLDTLPQREHEILSLRYGLEDGNELTLEEVGQIYNLTRERIRQIESKALRRLRHPRRLSIIDGFSEHATESVYLPESRTFIDQYYTRLLFDDIFTRVEIDNTLNKFYPEENEFSDMSQGQIYQPESLIQISKPNYD